MGGGGGAAAGHSEQSLYCQLKDPPASYTNRVDNPAAYNWCIVPDSSYDAVLFGGLAVLLACLLQGRLSSLMVLLAGAALMGLAWPVNLGALGNSLAMWLGISPWQTFFYVFLPPLLLDAAVRIDWFMFRKMLVQVLTLAFLVVGAGCVVMIPIMLYVLDLGKYGWTWIHACMFGAMVASTDAVAIVSIMKSSGGPKRLRILLEGESLLNDASGLTLFEVFLHLVTQYQEPGAHHDSAATVVGHVFWMVFKMGGIGFLTGMAFGMLTRLVLRFMAYCNASKDQEVALTLAMAYLAYWVTASPCQGSGVVAVAVMGLYGAATNHWDISTRTETEGTFDGFWETLAFIVNALVFLYAGAGVVNFMIRSLLSMTDPGASASEVAGFAVALWMMPIIFVLLTVLRFVLVYLFRPLYLAAGGDIGLRETAFITMAGLRGSASLIMSQAVVVETADTHEAVKPQMVFWTAGFVLLTLLLQAPALPFVLRLTRLNLLPPKHQERRRRAVEALNAHTEESLAKLMDDEDELMAGVDWAQVSRFVDHTKQLQPFVRGPKPVRVSRKSRIGQLLAAFASRCSCCWRRPALDALPGDDVSFGSVSDAGGLLSRLSKKAGGSSSQDTDLSAIELGRPLGTLYSQDEAVEPPTRQPTAAKQASLKRAASSKKVVAQEAAQQPSRGIHKYDDLGRPSVWQGFAPTPLGFSRDLEHAAEPRASSTQGSPGLERRGGARGRDAGRMLRGKSFVIHEHGRPTPGEQGQQQQNVDGADGNTSSSDEEGKEGSSAGSGRGGLFTEMLPGLADGMSQEWQQECPFISLPKDAPAGASMPAGKQAAAAQAAARAGGSRSSQPSAGNWSAFGWFQRRSTGPVQPPSLAAGVKGSSSSASSSRGPDKASPGRAGSGGSPVDAQWPKGDPALSIRTGKGTVAGAPARSDSSARPLQTRSSRGLNGHVDRVSSPLSPANKDAGGPGRRSPVRSPFAPAAAQQQEGGGLRALATSSFRQVTSGRGTSPSGGGGAAAAEDLVELGQQQPLQHKPLEGIDRALGRQRGEGGGSSSGLPRGPRESRSLATSSVAIAGRYGSGAHGTDAASPSPTALLNGDPAKPLSRAGKESGQSSRGPEGTVGRTIPDANMGRPLRPAHVRHQYGSDNEVVSAAATAVAAEAEGRSSGSQVAPRSLATRSVQPLPALHSRSVHPSMQAIAPSLYRMSKGMPGGQSLFLEENGVPDSFEPPAPPAGLAATSLGLLGLTRGSKVRRGGTAGGSNPPSADGGGGRGDLQTTSRSAASVLAGSVAEGEALEELADARHWLVSGLRRYFHGKRMEGLLSAKGLRILEAACDTLLEDAKGPLTLWCVIQRDLTGNWLVLFSTYFLFALRRAAVAAAGLGWLGRLVANWLRLLAALVQRPLNQLLLLSVEVAMEYLMGLTNSPYVVWMKESEVWGTLMQEVQREVRAVWQFLIDREIEAPERYSAVQSYRAAMAVLRQQQAFVQELYESGMIDQSEADQMVHPVEAGERRLELLGPVWRAPTVTEVIRQLPFMRGQPQEVKDFFLKHGHLVMYVNNSQLPQEGDLVIVQSGIVEVSYKPIFGEAQVYYLGTGGVYNLYASLVGEKVPGTLTAVAKGNTLGKGPVLFVFSSKGMAALKALAAQGAPAWQQLELDLHRLAGLFLLERLRPQLDLEWEASLGRVAPAEPLPAGGGAGRPGEVGPARAAAKLRRQQWVRSKLLRLRSSLKLQLALAELLVLPPNCSVAQSSAVMLLKGELQVKATLPKLSSAAAAGGASGAAAQAGATGSPAMTVGGTLDGSSTGAGPAGVGSGEEAAADPVLLPATADALRWMTNCGRHQFQSILPWLWDVVTPEELQQAPAFVPRAVPEVLLTAGPSGAILLICPSPGTDAALAAAAADAAAMAEAAAEGLPLTYLSGHATPLALASGPVTPGAVSRQGSPRASLDRVSLQRVSNPADRGAAASQQLGHAAGSAAGTPRGPAASLVGGSPQQLAQSAEHQARDGELRVHGSQPLAGAVIDNRLVIGMDAAGLLNAGSGATEASGGAAAAAAAAAVEAAPTPVQQSPAAQRDLRQQLSFRRCTGLPLHSESVRERHL